MSLGCPNAITLAQFSGLQVSDTLSKDYFDAEGQEGVNRRMIGTGPYQFVERVLGSHVLHERVDYDHWRIKLDFEEIQIFIALEPSTQLANLLAEVEADRGAPLDWTNARYWLSPRPELAEVQDVGEAVANYWQAIGVPIQIEERELAYAAEQFFARKISGIAWTDATPFRETDREQLRIIYASAGCCEFYSDDVVNQNYQKFLASVDLAERDEILRDTGNHLYE